MQVTVRTPDEFKTSFEEWMNHTVQKRIAQAKSAVAIAAYNHLMDTAPRWSGRYVGSINVSIGSPDTSVLPRHPATMGPSQVRYPHPVPNPYPWTFKDIEAELLSHGEAAGYINTWIYITNEVPYGSRVEDNYQVFAQAEAMVRAEFGVGYVWHFGED